MNPEERFSVIVEDLSVEFKIFFPGTLARILGPERMCIIQKLRTLTYLETNLLILIILLGSYCLDNLICRKLFSLVDGLSLICIGLA